MSITKTNIIQALGGLIVGNSLFSFFALPLWLLAVSQIPATSFSNPQVFTSSSNFLLNMANAVNQVTTWTSPISVIMWLTWLVLCFSKFNETETPKINLVGVILHYILGMIFFLIPLLYLPHRHYKKLLQKATGQNSKLLLVWQILNVLGYFLILPITLLALSLLIFPIILFFVLPVLIPVVSQLWFLAIPIFILMIIHQILGCYFIWQISTKL